MAAPVISTGCTASAPLVPFDLQFAAARDDFNRSIEQSAPNTADDRRAGSGAARQRLAGATLPDAQAYAMPIDDLHKARVDPIAKPMMVLDQRPIGRDRGGFDITHRLHCVRIAHR